MNVDNIPVHIRRIIQDRELSMAQKMVAFMAFMPSLPADPKMIRSGRIIQKLEKQSKR
jgi:hypothetical protein